MNKKFKKSYIKTVNGKYRKKSKTEHEKSYIKYGWNYFSSMNNEEVNDTLRTYKHVINERIKRIKKEFGEDFEINQHLKDYINRYEINDKLDENLTRNQKLKQLSSIIKLLEMKTTTVSGIYEYFIKLDEKFDKNKYKNKKYNEKLDIVKKNTKVLNDLYYWLNKVREYDADFYFQYGSERILQELHVLTFEDEKFDIQDVLEKLYEKFGLISDKNINENELDKFYRNLETGVFGTMRN